MGTVLNHTPAVRGYVRTKLCFVRLHKALPRFPLLNTRVPEDMNRQASGAGPRVWPPHRANCGRVLVTRAQGHVDAKTA